MEIGPGEEAQVGFGSSAPVVAAGGNRCKTNVFRIVLSYSRQAYSEATFTQPKENFFLCLMNAFAHFGGLPQTLINDNLRAAVAHPDWFDPELPPKSGRLVLANTPRRVYWETEQVEVDWDNTSVLWRYLLADC
jgi:hypothetical protein